MEEGSVMWNSNTYEILNSHLPEFVEKEEVDTRRLAALEYALKDLEAWGVCYNRDPNETQQHYYFLQGFNRALDIFNEALNDKH